MKKILIPFFSLCFLVSYSQQEASNWYFGDNAGIVFNPDGSITNLTNGELNTEEGCASISDENGDLLFYTDGITVWNRLHEPMSNANAAIGTGLYGDPSSTQSGIIVPKPDDPDIYYIFTVDTDSGGENDPDDGFNYSILDITLNGGLGNIVNGSKNINLLEDSSEKLSAVVKDCETKSIWVITFAPNDGIPDNIFDTFYAYEVTDSGVNTSPVTSNVTASGFDPRGYLKFSPDGTKIASANIDGGLFLYDYDKDTGIVSNPTLINISFNSNTNKVQSAYGLEFSPNSNLLYVATYTPPTQDNFNVASEQYGGLLQYDLTATNIDNTEVILDERQTYRGALQLAPNGKIYRSLSNTHREGTPFLGVVNNPNEAGTTANYTHNAVSLGRDSRQGLPPFITSFFIEKIDIINNDTSSLYLPLCIGETYTLTAPNISGATYTWTKDDIPLPETSFNLDIDSDGTYAVFIESIAGDCETFEGEALVEYFDAPVINQPEDIIICDNNNDGIFNFESFSEQNETILGTQDANVYEVSYHLSQNDADNNINPIIFPYNNGSKNPQEIFIRLGLFSNTTCYDTSKSFMLYIYNTPTANEVSNLIICDTETITDPNPSNGQITIDLHQFDIEVLGTQNATDYNITYYTSIQNATDKNAALDFNYYNQTPFNEDIYARIDNVLYEDCFDISEAINLTINPKPQFTNTTLIQCDDDGIKDNLTLFNLFEAKAELTNNEPNRELVFFETPNNLLTNTPIANPIFYQNLSNSQTVSVKIINTNTGCFSIAELILEISTNQINDYEVPAVCDEINSEDGINTFDLNDITAQIQLENNITFPITYYENYEDALSEENKLEASYQNTQAYTQTLYARAENNNACYGISEVLLTINELPNLQEDAPLYYCLNTYPETIMVNPGILNDSPDNYSYLWSNGETNYNIEVNEIGTYSVVVTSNINGCSKTKTINIEASNIAEFESPPYEIKDLSSNNSITVFASGEGTYQYALYNDNTIYRDFQDSNVFENVSPGIYTINVTDIKNNCGTIDALISVIGFPKYFTPNNDGVHDTWQIIGVSSMFQPNTKITIYNRYGKLIKEITPLGEGWDGLYNGQQLPADDYWFSATLQDGRIYKNHFTLKR